MSLRLLKLVSKVLGSSCKFVGTTGAREECFYCSCGVIRGFIIAGG